MTPNRALRGGILVAIPLWIWLRELTGQAPLTETLATLVGLPLFFLLTRPRLAQEVALRELTAALILFVLGAALDLGVLLAAGYTCLLAAFLERREPTRIALALVFFSFPWLAQEAAGLGWWLRLSGAWATQGVFQALGLAVERTGTTLLLPGLCLSVDAPCAGLNVLQIALVAGFALLIWERRLSRTWHVPVAVLALIGVAWLANVVRVVTLGGVALSFGVGVAGGALHEYIGLIAVVFILTLATRRPQKK